MKIGLLTSILYVYWSPLSQSSLIELYILAIDFSLPYRHKQFNLLINKCVVWIVFHVEGAEMYVDFELFLRDRTLK